MLATSVFLVLKLTSQTIAPQYIWCNRSTLLSVMRAGKEYRIPGSAKEIVIPGELNDREEDKVTETEAKEYEDIFLPTLIRRCSQSNVSVRLQFDIARNGITSKKDWMRDDYEFDFMACFLPNSKSSYLSTRVLGRRLDSIIAMSRKVTGEHAPSLILNFCFTLNSNLNCSTATRERVIRKIGIDPIDIPDFYSTDWEKAFTALDPRTQSAYLNFTGEVQTNYLAAIQSYVAAKWKNPFGIYESVLSASLSDVKRLPVGFSFTNLTKIQNPPQIFLDASANDLESNLTSLAKAQKWTSDTEVQIVIRSASTFQQLNEKSLSAFCKIKKYLRD
jgi:hypothetical protein